MAEPVVSTGGREYVPNAVKLLSSVFEDDPVIIYMLSSMSDKARLAYMESYMRSLITAAALNDAVFEEVNDWSSVAVWMKPGRKVDNPWTYVQAGGLKILWKIGFQGCKRMLVEFQKQSNAAKKKGLRNRTKYYYLFFVGTALDQRKKGLSSALIRRYQAVAQKEGVPVWLEATTSNSMRLYKSLGFELVQVIPLGQGTSGADGKPQEGGEGVKLWAMIWEPEAPK